MSDADTPQWWDVDLTIECRTVNLGSLAPDPDHWRDALAELLHDAADHIAGIELSAPCQDSGPEAHADNDCPQAGADSAPPHSAATADAASPSNTASAANSPPPTSTT